MFKVIILGALLCFQFFFISCIQGRNEVSNVTNLLSDCENRITLKESNLMKVPNLSIQLPDTSGSINTNIPIKIFGEKGYLITKSHKILEFDKFENSSVKSRVYTELPRQWCEGLADYYLLDNEVWIITQNDKNFVYSYDLTSKKIDTILSGEHYYWNAFPFLGSTTISITKNKFIMPFVKHRNDGFMSLFAVFEYRNKKLYYLNQYGHSEISEQKWSPFNEIAFYSSMKGDFLWITNSSSNGVLKVRFKSNRLHYINTVCFSRFKSFNYNTQNVDMKSYKSQNKVLNRFIKDMYNLRVIANSSSLVKLRKKCQPNKDVRSLRKNSINSAPWDMEVYNFASKKFSKMEFKSNSHYFALSFLFDNAFYVARQNIDENIVFDKIQL